MDTHNLYYGDYYYMNTQEVDVAGLGLDLTVIMDTWFEQMGFPVISVDINGANLEIRQTRFLSDPTADPYLPPSPFKYANVVNVDKC